MIVGYSSAQGSRSSIAVQSVQLDLPWILPSWLYNGGDIDTNLHHLKYATDYAICSVGQQLIRSDHRNEFNYVGSAITIIISQSWLPWDHHRDLCFIVPCDIWNGVVPTWFIHEGFEQESIFFTILCFFTLFRWIRFRALKMRSEWHWCGWTWTHYSIGSGPFRILMWPVCSETTKQGELGPRQNEEAITNPGLRHVP